MLKEMLSQKQQCLLQMLRHCCSATMGNYDLITRHQGAFHVPFYSITMMLHANEGRLVSVIDYKLLPQCPHGCVVPLLTQLQALKPFGLQVANLHSNRVDRQEKYH